MASSRLMSLRSRMHRDGVRWLLQSCPGAVCAMRASACGSARTFGASAGEGSRRLPPLAPPNLDEAQQELYTSIVDTRIHVVGKEALFDEAGGLRGPWNIEVASPALGRHLERLATAVRTENS